MINREGFGIRMPDGSLVWYEKGIKYVKDKK